MEGRKDAPTAEVPSAPLATFSILLKPVLTSPSRAHDSPGSLNRAPHLRIVPCSSIATSATASTSSPTGGSGTTSLMVLVDDDVAGPRCVSPMGESALSVWS